MNKSEKELLKKAQAIQPQFIKILKSCVLKNIDEIKSLDVYGFSLCPGADYELGTIMSAYQTEGNYALLKKGLGSRRKINETYYRYSVDEWGNYYKGSCYAKINAFIKAQNKNILTEISINNKRHDECYISDAEELYVNYFKQSMVTAMRELIIDGKIKCGSKNIEYCVVWYSDSNDKIIKSSMRELNAPELFSKLKKEFK